MNLAFFYVDGRVHVHHIPKEDMATRITIITIITMWGQCNVVGNILLGNQWPWHSCRYYFDSYYLNTVADQVHPFLTVVFIKDSGDLQDSMPCHTAVIDQ